MLRLLANESEIWNALSQSLSFHVPLDKGNEGSGNEIVINPVEKTKHSFSLLADAALVSLKSNSFIHYTSSSLGFKLFHPSVGQFPDQYFKDIWPAIERSDSYYLLTASVVLQSFSDGFTIFSR